VVFSDDHGEAANGMPVALVQGCIAHNQQEITRLALRPSPGGVRLYVEPGTTATEIASLWLAGFQVRLARSTVGWLQEARRHHAAETRGVRCPRPAAATTFTAP
jgi:hypothetical protein